MTPLESLSNYSPEQAAEIAARLKAMQSAQEQADSRDTAAAIQQETQPQEQYDPSKDPNVPKISAPTTVWDLLKQGKVWDFYNKAKSEAKEAVYKGLHMEKIFGPSDTQKLRDSVPVTDNDGNLQYVYKPMGSAIDKRGLVGAPSDMVVDLLHPGRALQMYFDEQDGVKQDKWSQGSFDFEGFDRAREEGTLQASPDDNALTAIGKATYNTLQNVSDMVTNPQMWLVPESKVLSYGFAADMTDTALQQARQGFTAPTLQGKLEGWLGALMSAGMAYSAGKHATGKPTLDKDVSKQIVSTAPTLALKAAVQDPKLSAHLDPSVRKGIVAELDLREQAGKPDLYQAEQPESPDDVMTGSTTTTTANGETNTLNTYERRSQAAPPADASVLDRVKTLLAQVDDNEDWTDEQKQQAKTAVLSHLNPQDRALFDKSKEDQQAAPGPQVVRNDGSAVNVGDQIDIPSLSGDSSEKGTITGIQNGTVTYTTEKGGSGSRQLASLGLREEAAPSTLDKVAQMAAVQMSPNYTPEQKEQLHFAMLNSMTPEQRSSVGGLFSKARAGAEQIARLRAVAPQTAAVMEPALHAQLTDLVNQIKAKDEAAKNATTPSDAPTEPARISASLRGEIQGALAETPEVTAEPTVLDKLIANHAVPSMTPAQYAKSKAFRARLAEFLTNNPAGGKGDVDLPGLSAAFHQEAIKQAMEQGRAVSAKAVESYGLTAPEGYAADGSQLVQTLSPEELAAKKALAESKPALSPGEQAAKDLFTNLTPAERAAKALNDNLTPAERDARLRSKNGQLSPKEQAAKDLFNNLTPQEREIRYGKREATAIDDHSDAVPAEESAPASPEDKAAEEALPEQVRSEGKAWKEATFEAFANPKKLAEYYRSQGMSSEAASRKALAVVKERLAQGRKVEAPDDFDMRRVESLYSRAVSASKTNGGINVDKMTELLDNLRNHLTRNTEETGNPNTRIKVSTGEVTPVDFSSPRGLISRDASTYNINKGKGGGMKVSLDVLDGGTNENGGHGETGAFGDSPTQVQGNELEMSRSTSPEDQVAVANGAETTPGGTTSADYASNPRQALVAKERGEMRTKLRDAVNSRIREFIREHSEGDQFGDPKDIERATTKLMAEAFSSKIVDGAESAAGKTKGGRLSAGTQELLENEDFLDKAKDLQADLGEMIVREFGDSRASLNDKERQPSGLDHAELADALRPHTDSLGEAGKAVTVVQSEQDLPPHVQRSMERQGFQGRVRGAYDPSTGRIFVVADAHTDIADATKTLLHEAVGEHGIDQVLRPEDWKAIRDAVLAEPDAAEVSDAYKGRDLAKLSEADKDDVARETLARMAEDPNYKPNLWQKVVATLHAALRKLGFDVPFTDADFRSLVQDAREKAAKNTGLSGEENSRFSLKSREAKAKLDHLTEHGIYDQRDAITGGSTAIGRIGAGYSSAMGAKGAPVYGADFPTAARNRDAGTHRLLAEVARGIEQDRAQGIVPASVGSRALVEVLAGKAGVSDSEAAKALAELRSRIPVVSADKVMGLRPLEEGQTSKVYVDKPNGAAYKLMAVDADGKVGGFLPGKINERADGSVSIQGTKRIPVADALASVGLGNEHGGPVYTEIAGVTDEGHVILKQPFVAGLKSLDYLDDPEATKAALDKLNLVKLTDIGSLAAVGKTADGKMVVFDDLHGENLMADKSGNPYLIDAIAARALSDEEVNRITPKLASEPQPLSAPETDALGAKAQGGWDLGRAAELIRQATGHDLIAESFDQEKIKAFRQDYRLDEGPDGNLRAVADKETDPILKNMAKGLIDRVPKNTSIELNPELAAQNLAGRALPMQHRIELDPGTASHRTMLEENAHMALYDKIEKFNKALYDQLSKEDIANLSSLANIYEHVLFNHAPREIQELVSDPRLTNNARRAGFDLLEAKKPEMGKWYHAISLHEFVAGALLDKDFQNQLKAIEHVEGGENTIKQPAKTSVFAKLRDLFIKLITGGKDNALYQTIDNGLSLIERTRSTDARNTIEFPVDEELGSFLGGIRNLWKDRDAMGKAAVRVFADRLNGLKDAEKLMAERRGIPQLPDSEAAHLASENYHGKVPFRLDKFVKAWVDPIYEEMQGVRKLGGNDTNVNEWLNAKHTPERNMQIASINLSKPDGGSGMTTADARAILAKYAGTPMEKHLERISQLVQGMNRESLQNMLDGGLITQNSYNAMSSKYSDYVTLQGFDGQVKDPDEGVLPRLGSGFDIRGQEPKRAMGRDSRAADILQNTIEAAAHVIIRQEKNYVMQRLGELVRNNPDPDLWEFAKAKYEPQINKKTGMVEMKLSQAYRTDDRVIAYKENGELRYLDIKDENLAKNLKNAGLASNSVASRLFFNGIGQFQRWRGALSTGFSIDFLFSNILRHMQEVSLNLTGPQLEGIKSAVRKDLWSGKALAETFKATVTGSTSPYAQSYREMQAAGGKMSFLGLSDIQTAVKRAVNGATQSKVGAGLKAVGDLMHTAGEIMENSTRLAVYHNLREAGVSVDQAAHAARNISLNYNRKGEVGNVMNTLWMFSNARVQNELRMVDAIKQRGPKAAVSFMGKLVAAGYVMATISRMLGGQNQQTGRDAYDEVPDFERRNNFIFMVPESMRESVQKIPGIGHFLGDGGRWLKFVMPYGYNVFFSAGTSLEKYMHNSMTGVHAVSDIVGSAMDTYNPVGGAGSLLQMMMPSVLRPVVDLQTNRNFAGTPLHPDQPMFGPPKPSSELYFRSASPASVWVAKKLNEITGGNEYHAGSIGPVETSFSPATFDYMTNYLFGAVGDTVSRLAKDGYNLATGQAGEKMVPNDIPVLRKFLGNETDSTTHSAYSYVSKAATLAKKEVDGKTTQGDAQGAVDATNSQTSLLRVYPALQQVEAEKMKLSRLKNEINASTSLSDEDKNAALDHIDEVNVALEKELIQQFVRIKRARGESLDFGQ